MNSSQIKQNWDFLPTMRQLNGICEYYDLQPKKNASREELLCLLDERNVQMEITSYSGPHVELRGAIMHWMKDPQASSTSESESCDETNDVPKTHDDDTKVDASLAALECCPPSDFDVQYEEEVEAVEY